MNYRLIVTVLICLAALAVGPVFAAEEFCVRFDGIQGSGSLCDNDGSRAWEYHHLAAREVDNGIPGPLRHHQVILTKRPDKADPFLWSALVGGTVIPQVIIESPVTSPDRARFRITLTNVHILGIEPIIPNVNNPASFVDQTRIRMDYQSITVLYDGEEAGPFTP
jgi:type VI protein secretion system component Hcp